MSSRLTRKPGASPQLTVDLAESARPRVPAGDEFDVGLRTADDLDQTHRRGRVEEMQRQHPRAVTRPLGDLRDAE